LKHINSYTTQIISLTLTLLCIQIYAIAEYDTNWKEMKDYKIT